MAIHFQMLMELLLLVFLLIIITEFRLKLTQKQLAEHEMMAQKILKSFVPSKDFTVPLKYLSIFSRNVEMPLINCEINLILTWSALHKICENTDFH